MAKPLRYTHDVDPSWAGRAVRDIEVSASPDAEHPLVLDLAGRCPRCNDGMRDTHWLITFSGVTSMSRTDALRALKALRESGVADEPLLPAEFTVQCRCDTPHPDPLGRKGLRGCGAVWRMRFEVVDEDAG